MSDDNVLPNKSTETDSTPPPIGQPDHIASDPTATPSPDAAPILNLPPRSPVTSEDTAFLSPLFTEVATALEVDFSNYLLDGKVENIGLEVPYVLVTIIDSDISAKEKLYWLKFFLRFVSIIDMVFYYDPSEYTEDFGDLVPDGEVLTKESIFALLLSELTPSMAIRNSEYVYFRDYWYTGYGFVPGEATVAACIYETLARYFSQFVKPPNDH